MELKKIKNMKHIKFFEELTNFNLELNDEEQNKLLFYKSEYKRNWNDRLEEDFKKIIKGYPIKITDFKNRNDVREELVLPLKEENDMVFYKAYVTPEEIAKNPQKYDFVSPLFRDANSLYWVIQHVKSVKFYDSKLVNYTTHLVDGGSTYLWYLFLVDYRKP